MPQRARSFLFVPGSRPERFDKALAAGADVVVIDLEDAVPPDAKDAARAAVAAWLAESRPVVLRVNATDTAWFSADLALAQRPGVLGLMLPKAERAEQVLRAAAARVAILPMIETAQGFHNAQAMARVHGVARLVFGTIDFQFDLGIAGDDEALLLFRSQLVLQSRLAGVAAPVDGVTTAIDDAALLEADARRARRLGFGAKLCIHPRQVAPVHRGFAPQPAELAWAQRVLDAAQAAGGAAVAVDGRMIDKPVMLRAEQILRAAQGER